MESKQFSTGGHLWMESSFLPTKKPASERASSARVGLEYYNRDLGLDMLRIEDQIF